MDTVTLMQCLASDDTLIVCDKKQNVLDAREWLTSRGIKPIFEWKKVGRE